MADAVNRHAAEAQQQQQLAAVPPFHLAFPVRDVDEARAFYGGWVAGCLGGAGPPGAEPSRPAQHCCCHCRPVLGCRVQGYIPPPCAVAVSTHVHAAAGCMLHMPLRTCCAVPCRAAATTTHHPTASTGDATCAVCTTPTPTATTAAACWGAPRAGLPRHGLTSACTATRSWRTWSEATTPRPPRTRWGGGLRPPRASGRATM